MEIIESVSVKIQLFFSPTTVLPARTTAVVSQSGNPPRDSLHRPTCEDCGERHNARKQQMASGWLCSARWRRAMVKCARRQAETARRANQSGEEGQ